MSESRTEKIFVRNIRRLRELHEYTLAYVAEAIGVQEAAVSKYENGHLWPKAPTIDRLADLYLISVADLFKPEGAAEKGYSLAATKLHALEVVNGMIKNGEVGLTYIGDKLKKV